jgi:hypothetical protein
MFANNIGLNSRFAPLVLALISAIASGSVVQAADPALNSDAEIKQLAQARQMVQDVLNHFDFKTWNQLLADDVVLNIRLGTATKDTAGDPALLGMKVEYKGRDAAKQALREIYGDLHKDFKVITQIAHGPEVVLMGELAVTSKGKDPATLPIAVYMAFNPAGKIERMGIFSVDVRALVASLQTATSG